MQQKSNKYKIWLFLMKNNNQMWKPKFCIFSHISKLDWRSSFLFTIYYCLDLSLFIFIWIPLETLVTKLVVGCPFSCKLIQIHSRSLFNGTSQLAIAHAQTSKISSVTYFTTFSPPILELKAMSPPTFSLFFSYLHGFRYIHTFHGKNMYFFGLP